MEDYDRKYAQEVGSQLAELARERRLKAMPPDEVGKRFKRYRELAGLSVGQAAKLTNVDREEITKTEDGHYEEVAPALILSLAQLYQCPAVGAFFNAGWDEKDPMIILEQFARGEISEGAAARMLSVNRLEVRRRMEQHREQEGEQ